MKELYIELITKILPQCNDEALLELIYKLLLSES